MVPPGPEVERRDRIIGHAFIRSRTFARDLKRMIFALSLSIAVSIAGIGVLVVGCAT